MKITKLEKQKRLYLLQIDQTEELYITEDTTVCIFFLSPGSDFVKKFMWSEIFTTSIAQFWTLLLSTKSGLPFPSWFD